MADYIFAGPPKTTPYTLQKLSEVDISEGNIPPASVGSIVEVAAIHAADTAGFGILLFGEHSVLIRIAVHSDDATNVFLDTPIPLLAWDAVPGTSAWRRNQGEDLVVTFATPDGAGPGPGNEPVATATTKIEDPISNVTRAWVPDISAINGVVNDDALFQIDYFVYCAA